MGATGTSLTVSGAGDRQALLAAVWGHAHRFIRKWCDPPADVEDYLYGGMTSQVDGDELQWWFKDLAGCCARSEAAWLHWLEYTFAADWDVYRQLAAEHGLAIVSERPKLADVLARSTPLLELRDYLWNVDEEGLSGDDEFVPVGELTAGERARHAQALKSCRCGLCLNIAAP